MKLRNLVYQKRGQLSPLEMVAAVIIVVFILVIILYAVNSGFRSYVNNIFSVSGKANIDNVKQNCENSCNIYGKDSEDYKNSPRDLVFADGFKTSLTCKELESPIYACKSGTWLANVDELSCNGAGNSQVACYYSSNKSLVTNNPNKDNCLKVSGALFSNTEVCVKDNQVLDISLDKCTSGRGSWEAYREALLSVCTVTRS